MHPSLNHLEHRPWPIPEDPWVWRQSWCDLLFIHWAIQPEELKPLIPEPLEVDLYDGMGWLGVVPFVMKGVMRRPLPDLPYFSEFPELNVRTYVKYEGKPGVWFFSLDATNLAAVWAAKKFFHLPYFHSQIDMTHHDDFHYKNSRFGSNKQFEARYKATSNTIEYPEGSFETWSTERYCLYSQNKEQDLFRAEVHHKKWPLQKADVEIMENTMINHINHEQIHPTVLFSKRIDVIVWPLEKISTQQKDRLEF